MTAAIVVTGASTGIGAATVLAAAARGFIAFAGVRTESDASRMAAAHGNVRALRLDVTERASIDAAAGTVAASGCTLCGVVSNAGIALAGPLEYLPVDELRRIFAINVFGAVDVAQAFLPQLRRSRGRLVFVGSISGRLSFPFVAPYSASKFALRAIADALRVELRPAGVGVTLIESGSAKTPIWEKGRASRDALSALMPPESIERYGPQLEAVFAHTEAEERSAMPVERVSDAIVHALTARHPRASYVVGTPARLGTVLAMLPTALRDRVMRASMKRQAT